MDPVNLIIVLIYIVVCFFPACDCDAIGSVGRRCDPTTGQCVCHPHHGGRSCGECADGYYNYPACERQYLIE